MHDIHRDTNDVKDGNLTPLGEDADSGGEGSVSNGGRCGGEAAPLDPRFRWTRFYEAMANGLLAFRSRRGELLAEICEFDRNLKRKKKTENLGDICPFSVMARFNRVGCGYGKRANFARNLASFLRISESVPEAFDCVGIPILPSTNVLFFDLQNERKSEDINTMWEVFACALALARSDGMEEPRKAFLRSYDKALKVKWVDAPKLTIGLYWLRPWFFPSLDGNSWEYIEDVLDIFMPFDSPKKKGPKGKTYLDFRKETEARFEDENYPVRSFPELAFKSAEYKKTKRKNVLSPP